MASTEEQILTGDDGDVVVSTLPFSENHFSILEELRQAGDPDLPQSPDSKGESPQIPLGDLDVSSVPFRILLYPADRASLRTDKGDWTTVPCKPCEGRPRGVPCMVVRQRREDIGCEILSPLQCMLYYDPGSDVLQLLNKATKHSLYVQALGGKDAPQEIIRAYKTTALKPGSYTLWGRDAPAVQIIVSLREHSLSCLRRPDYTRISGIKRTSSSLKTTRDDSPSTNPTTLAIRYPINSISSTSGGQTIVLHNALGDEYSFTRLRTIAETYACEIFEAKHSLYNDRVIIVKRLRFPETTSPRYRGQKWLNEYQIHKELKFTAIVELYGGDARVETLWVESDGSVSLSQPKWRNTRTDYFMGTLSDAQRILADIASALLYLRTKAVIHNDIKPSNIVYSRQSGAKFIDFGIATRDNSPASKSGSPWYIPPEFLALRERKGPADIWALGIVMLYLLNRIPLPDGQTQAKTWQIDKVGALTKEGGRDPATFAMEDWLRLVSGERQRLRDLGKVGYMGEMAEVVQRMLEPDVMNRIGAQELDAMVRQITEETQN